MFKTILTRIGQGHRTLRRLPKPQALPDRFRGRPILDASLCQAGCTQCQAVCPTSAILKVGPDLTLDLGRCVFCGLCAEACPKNAIKFSTEYRLSARTHQELLCSSNKITHLLPQDFTFSKILGRSLKLRQVSAGGCNACEADTNVLNTLAFDLARFGIQFVASPRHADGILVTGPVTHNMRLALEKTYKAIPPPKIVIAVGACAISGGLFANSPTSEHRLSDILPVDLLVPGCPPHPLTILSGIISLMKNKANSFTELD